MDRVPVVEVLTANQDLRAAIASGASAVDIRAAMKAAGCASMRESALSPVERGVTSLDEIDRVLAVGEGECVPAQQATRGVLIADDDQMLRTLVKLLLEKDGYTVSEAEHGAQAVEFARRKRPDLLMIDLTMPEVDGYQAIAELRRDLNFASVPILVLTAERGPGTEQRVLDLGADDYLIKPFQPAILMARVRALFRRQQSSAASSQGGFMAIDGNAALASESYEAVLVGLRNEFVASIRTRAALVNSLAAELHRGETSTSILSRLVREAHTLKGSAGTFGFPEVGEAAGEVERAALGGDQEVVMLTAHSDLPSKLRGFDAGADDYLVKPIEVSELATRVTRMLDKQDGTHKPSSSAAETRSGKSSRPSPMRSTTR